MAEQQPEVEDADPIDATAPAVSTASVLPTIASSIPLPPPLALSKGNAAVNWKRFRDQWANYEEATLLTSQPSTRRAAILLSCIGTDAYDIFRGMAFPNDNDKHDVDKIMLAFDKFCIGEINVSYERYVLNKRVQEANESFDNFLSDTRHLIRSCEYGNLADSVVRDRLICGVKDESLRQKLLTVRQLDLAKAIDMCRANESAQRHLRDMRGSDEVHAVTSYRRPTAAYHRQRSQSQSRQHHVATAGPRHTSAARPTSDSTSRTASRRCKFCNRQHEFRKTSCLAYNKICNACGLKNHFSNSQVCKKRSNTGISFIESDDTDDSAEDVLALETSQTSHPKKLYAKMNLGKQSDIPFLLDTGASANLMSLHLLHKAFGRNCNLQSTSRKLLLYDKSELQTVGVTRVPVTNPRTNTLHDLDFYVTDSTAQSPLIGAQDCLAMGLLQVNHENVCTVKLIEQSEKMTGINLSYSDAARSGLNCSDSAISRATAPLTKAYAMHHYKDIFNGIGKLQGEFHISLHEDVFPVRVPLRRVPVGLRAKVQTELDKMETDGIIVKENGITEWLNALVIVSKKNGEIRTCLDPQNLNRALVKVDCILPTLEDILPNLSRAKVFSSCDVSKAFWSIVLDHESSMLTAFMSGSNNQKYRYLRLPFGLSISSAAFQNRLMDALAGLHGIACIADDILIYGIGDDITAATKDHDANLLALLDRCRQKGLKLNKDKFKFQVDEFDFMGYTLTPEGLHISKDKVMALDLMPAPSDLKGVQRLLGMAAFLAKFVPQYSEVIAPIRTLLERDSEFYWDESYHGVALSKLKTLLKTAPVLRFFDDKAPITVQCDSSQHGLGAVLFQYGRPVAYVSRALTKTEEGYAQIEKEALSILFALERLHTYVYGKRITVENDHKPLMTIFKKALLSAPRRLQRIMLRLQNYQFDLVHIYGKEAIVSDTLSRAFSKENPTVSASERFSEDVAEVTDHCNDATFLAASPQTIETIRQAAIRDEVYHLLKRQIIRGWPESKDDVPNDIREYYNFCDELSVDNDFIYKGERLLVPHEARPYIIERSHLSHMGVNSCINRARSVVFWPKMTSQIADYISQCKVCAKYKNDQSKEPLLSHEIPSRPWEKVGCDLFMHNGKDYLITVDYYSNFFEIDRLENKRAPEVIKKLKTHASRYGLFSTLISDGGPPFSSNEFYNFSHEYDFVHIFSSPRFPQSNGLAEKSVCTAKRLMTKAHESSTDIYLALLEYRNTPSAFFHKSPAQRFLQRTTRTLMPIKKSLLQVPGSDQNQQSMKLAKSSQAYYYNRDSHIKPPLEENQTVRVKLDNNSNFLPARVIQKLPFRSYKVQLEDNRIFRRNRRHIRTSNEAPIVHHDSSTDIYDVPTQQIAPPPSPPSTPVVNMTQNTVASVKENTAAPIKSIIKADTNMKHTRSGRIVRLPVRFQD